MKFLVYSKTGCPYCTKVMQVLEMTGKQFVEYKLGRDFTGQEFYDKFGKGSTFPQVLCDDRKLGGCVDTIQFLREEKVI
jgi:glutaredoxin